MKVLITLDPPLGDALAAMPYINKYTLESGNDVYVRLGNPFFEQFFDKSFPNVKFIRHISNIDKTIHIKIPFIEGLQEGIAKQLGYDNAPYIRPTCDSFKKDRPIKNKYVVIGVHSTAQLKYWNHPNGKSVQGFSPKWNDLCGMLRTAGLTPIVAEKDELFGIPPYYNGLPSKANRKTNISLIETANYIEHAEFFIGLSSGLTWLAHALGQRVAMIANFTKDHFEFDIKTDDYIRITNTNVCHGCWHEAIEYPFDPMDWYWCPHHANTNRQFECHTSITPTQVFDAIKKWI